MLYDVSYRIRPGMPWKTYAMDPPTYLWWVVNTRPLLADWVVIPRGNPSRIVPSCPKRYGGQIEGNPIKEGYHDRVGGNCRQFEHLDPATPSARRTDIVAMQCGMSPAEIMARATKPACNACGRSNCHHYACLSENLLPPYCRP